MNILENTVYLDNSSTTKPCEGAIKEINSALSEDWGNPSSLYDLGLNAQLRVDAAREKMAKMLCCRADEIYFTSCGTEGNNTAILGAANARKKRGNRIVTTAIEHPSVLEAMKRLEADGFEVVYLKPDESGSVREEDIACAINNKTILVSIMLVNNETGAIQPVAAAARAIKAASAPALLHCDAVQAFGKIEINAARLGADLITVSGHKIHGPKGIGALYIKKGVTIKPLLIGGGQEKNMRSGTESVPLICGFLGAMNEIPNIKTSYDKMRSLWLYARDILLETGLVEINSSDAALPYVLNISVTGYRSETLLHFLEAKGIYVSSGSACAKGKGSYVLTEMGLSTKRVDSALRISFSRYNTKEDADRLREAIVEATNKLRRAN